MKNINYDKVVFFIIFILVLISAIAEICDFKTISSIFFSSALIITLFRIVWGFFWGKW